MAGTKNDVIVAKNGDFSQAGAPNGASGEANGLITNSQLWIGSTALNPGGTHVNVGTVVSPDGSLTLGYTSPNITAIVAGGTTTGKTITPDSGGALSPTGGNWDILGQPAGTIPVMFTSGAGSTLNVEDRTWTTAFVVDPSATVGLRGTYQTIAAALTDAVSGQNIFIRPGTYTENLTLKAGVNLVAYAADATTPNVTIAGTCTLTAAGTVTLSGIRLQTNAAACLAVTGSAASIVNLVGCYLDMTDNTGITFSSSSSSAKIMVYNSYGNLGTTGIAIFTHTSAGRLEFNNVPFLNTGGSTTASTASAGTLIANYSFFANPITTSGTNSFGMGWCNFSAANTTCLTIGGSGGNNLFLSTLLSGSASSMSVGSTFSCISCSFNTNNTNAITGAGTLLYTDLSFFSSSNINTTTQTKYTMGPSLTVGSTNTGNTNIFTLTNPSNTASSQAQEVITVGGGTAGDPFTTYTVTGATSWSHGIDNSASDAFVLSASTALGTTNVMSAATGGAVSFVLGNTDTTRSSSGATVSNTISNTSNTASSNALQQVTVAGTSAGDAFTTYTVSGTTNWSLGTDNSVTGDPFVIAASTALGTTNIMSSLTTGEINYPLQPAFLGLIPSDVTNATGDGTNYNLVPSTEVFDQNGDYNAGTGVFTAPVTGRYYIGCSCHTSNFAAGHTSEYLNLPTSNRQYEVYAQSPLANVAVVDGSMRISGNFLADMDAADTAFVTVVVFGSTKTVTIDGHATDVVGGFWGNLEC